LDDDGPPKERERELEEGLGDEEEGSCSFERLERGVRSRDRGDIEGVGQYFIQNVFAGAEGQVSCRANGRRKGGRRWRSGGKERKVSFVSSSFLLSSASCSP